MINKISIIDKDRFYQLGILINSNFNNLYNLEDTINSTYDDVFGYYVNNELVGFIHINKMYENIDIVNVVVSKEFRNKGIGSKLIEYVFNVYDDVSSVMLEVNENNVIAYNLYKKLGFNEINRRLNYYGGKDTAIIMKRDVGNERC